MLDRMYETEVCSAARALEVVGERWSLLVVRNLMFAGMSRFTELQRSLGVAPNVLARRLQDFVEAGVVEQRGEPGRHAEYLLTEKGWALQPVVVALTEWGDRWAPGSEGRPITYRHRDCGGEVATHVECSRCGASPEPPDVEADVAPWVHDAREERRARRRTPRP